MRKMFVMVYNISLGSKIEECLKKCKIEKFTIIPHVIGKGQSGGARFNNDVFPGENNLCFIVFENSNELNSFKEHFISIKKEYEKDGITYFVLPVE